MPSVACVARVAALGIALTSCGDLPGDVIGAYTVRMHVEENSCGPSGLPLPEGHAYPVELRAEAPEGYWRVPKAAPIKGRYRDGAFEFSFAMTLELGKMDAGTSGCLVRRQEQLRGRIEARAEDGGVADDASGDRDAGDRGTVLIGEHRISFSPDPAGRCANVAGPVHVFERLPCSALYSLFGVQRNEF